MSDWKERLGVVYSTNPNLVITQDGAQEEQPSVLPAKQNLRVALDKRNRGGKKVTIVSDFKGPLGELESLGKTLKTKCGVGGGVKYGEIIIQGDFRDKVVALLLSLGYRARKI